MKLQMKNRDVQNGQKEVNTRGKDQIITVHFN